MCFDYRGVGRSRGGRSGVVGGVASDIGLELDVDAALQFARSLVARRRAARARAAVDGSAA